MMIINSPNINIFIINFMKNTTYNEFISLHLYNYLARLKF